MKVENSTETIMNEIINYEHSCYASGKVGLYQQVIYTDNKRQLSCKVTVPGTLNIYLEYILNGQPIVEDVFFLPEKTKKGVRFNAVTKGTVLPRDVARRAESLMGAYQKYMRSLK